MKGIEKIIERINGDAQGEINAILDEAKAQAAEIAARYDAQAKAEAEDILSRGEKAAAEREERLVSVAQLECRKGTLGARQEVIEEAFQLAMKRLRALPEDKYVALLAKLAVKASSTGSEQLSFSAKDQNRVAAAVVSAANEQGKLNLTLSGKIADVDGGFILTSGAVEVNCGFETLMRLQRGEITGEVSGVLFQ